MRLACSAVSFWCAIVPSILAAERLGQDAPVQRLGRGEVEQPGQRRCDVDRADAPAIGAAPYSWAPLYQRHVRVKHCRLGVLCNWLVLIAPVGVVYGLGVV